MIISKLIFSAAISVTRVTSFSPTTLLLHHDTHSHINISVSRALRRQYYDQLTKRRSNNNSIHFSKDCKHNEVEITAAPSPAPTPTPRSVRIPKELLFGNLEYRSPIISPDGKYVAYLAPNHKDGSCCYIHVRQLLLNDSGSSNNVNVHTSIVSPDNRIHSFFWAQDSRSILYFVNEGKSGDEMFHLWISYAIDMIESSSLSSSSLLSPSPLKNKDNETTNYHQQKNTFIRDLTPGTNIKVKNIITNINHPSEIFLAMNKRNNALFDIYKCNIHTGDLHIEIMNPGDIISWGSININDDVSTKFDIKYAIAKNQTDGSTIIRIRDDDDDDDHIQNIDDGDGNPIKIKKDIEYSYKQWRDLITFPYGELGTMVALCTDQKHCWITSSCGRDTTALLKINIHTGMSTMLHDHKINQYNESHVMSRSPHISSQSIYFSDKCDIGEIIFDKYFNNVQMVGYNYGKKTIQFYDDEMQEHYKILFNQGPRIITDLSEIKIISQSQNQMKWIVSYEPSNAPISYAIYDTTTKQMVPLFCSQPKLLNYIPYFAPMDVVSITARDGLKLVGYLTKPLNDNIHHKNKRTNSSKETFKVPMSLIPLILLVHGGPWERDYYGFNPMVQWLANLGYAVLQVNYRGSSGYGKAFMNKGDKQWGIGYMQHDLTDSVKYCIENGIAQEGNVCIFGSSYGGYACLSGLCFTPELYKCGVNIAGVSH